MTNFNPDEETALAPYFTNTDQACFALRNLPEVVKGALFARYSRSPETLRRLFLNEFLDGQEIPATGDPDPRTGAQRAQALYERVLGQYGDDSVAQLGSAHVACEGVSNVLTKVLERGRLMSYLQQSTRYIPYNRKTGQGRWRYETPVELQGDLRDAYESRMDKCFRAYATCLEKAKAHWRKTRPQRQDEPDPVYQRAVQAKALDSVRGLLPAATASNLGIHGSGQAFEALLLRLAAHELHEARATGKAMLAQLKTVIPEFVQRVERPDRGGQWIDFLKKRRRFERTLAACTPTAPPEAPGGAAPEVKLVESDPDGEARVLAGLAYEATDEPFETLVQHAKTLPADIRESILARCAADRSNRRHKPGRGLEQARYTFEVTGDYGAFRDLQRHRMLTIEWQKLSTAHGLTEPPEIQEMGADQEWNQAMNAAQEAYEYVQLSAGPTVAQYCVPMAFHIQFLLTLNARELMHMIELRTQPQGHPSYRRVCQAMHRLIADNAGHRGIAKLISFANHDDVDLERLEAERRAHARAGA